MKTSTALHRVLFRLLSIILFCAFSQAYAQTMESSTDNSYKNLPVDAIMKVTAQPFGTPLGSFNGVVAYSNGSGTFVGPDTGTYGIPYQCVEYVNRYYAQHFRFPNMKGHGNASDLYSNLATTFGLKQKKNAGGSLPQVGDILCFAGGSDGSGHAAIVRAVTNTQVTVIQQNVKEDYGDTAFVYPVAKSVGGMDSIEAWPLGSSYSCQGWLTISGTSLVDELNGSTLGHAVGITYGPALSGEGAVFGRVNQSRIEYAFDTQIPRQGTVEWWVKVNAGYYYSNYVLYDSTSDADIFETGDHGGDVFWPGGTRLTVYRNGDVRLAVDTAFATAGAVHVLTAHNTGFTFDQWHAVGISFGSEGAYIMVDGKLVASDPNFTLPLSSEGNFSAPIDTPTIGQLISGFWGPNQYDGGFYGIVDRFRASTAQQDWDLSDTVLSQTSNNTTTVMDEFNGSTLGNPVGITYAPALSGQGAVFGRANQSRIEYAFDTQIPRQGTLEWWVNVNAGYYYSNYALYDSTENADIFETGDHGGDVFWPGGARLTVSSNGDITFATDTAFATAGAVHILTAHNTGFSFDQWHAIGVSFGSQGQYIMLDNKVVASDPQFTLALNSEGNFFAPVDTPTIGQLISVFWGPNQYDGGFYGTVDRFRASTKQLDWSLTDTVLTDVRNYSSALPRTYALYQNYPNPFNPSTVISYQLPSNAFVVLKVFDVLGREVETLVDQRESAGNHSVTFNASSLPSGVYLYRLQAGVYHDTKKLLLLK